MNVIKHKVITIEYDIWEPTEKQTMKELDEVVQFTKAKLSHAGNVKIVMREERIQ